MHAHAHTFNSSVPTHCTATGGYPELIAEIDRLTSLVNTGYGNPAGVGAAHPLYALYVGIRDTANKLKVYGQYGFSYGQFRALYAYIIYAVIEAAKAGAYSATLAAPGGTVSAAAAAMTATGNSLCGANPYMGILPGVTGCTIMNDFLDYIINGMGRALAWDAGTIAASVALGNPADTYITELTAEQMLWTGYTSKFGTDLNLAPQPGQNILGFGRKGTDAGTGDQTATDQPTKWPTGISAPGGGETGPWDAIIQLGNGKYRAANAEVTKEDAYYEMCGTTNVCVGGCTASTSDYDTWTHSYNMKGVSFCTALFVIFHRINGAHGGITHTGCWEGHGRRIREKVGQKVFPRRVRYARHWLPHGQDMERDQAHIQKASQSGGN